MKQMANRYKEILIYYMGIHFSFVKGPKLLYVMSVACETYSEHFIFYSTDCFCDFCVWNSRPSWLGPTSPPPDEEPDQQLSTLGTH